MNIGTTDYLDGWRKRKCTLRLLKSGRHNDFEPGGAPAFCGREAMAPTSGRMRRQIDSAALGPHPQRPTRPLWPGAVDVTNRIEGEVVAVDSFGNLVTNITRQMLTGAPRDEHLSIRCDEHETHSLFDTYADQPPTTLVALFGSNDRLKLAIVHDSAKTMLGVEVGTAVEVWWIGGRTGAETNK